MAFIDDPLGFLAAVLIPSSLAAIGFFLDYLDLTQTTILVLSTFVLVMLVGLGQRYFERQQKESALRQRGTNLSDNLTLLQAKRELEKFGEEAFAGNNSVNISFSSITFDSTKVYHNQTDTEFEMFAFLFYGENDKLSFAVMDGRTGDIKTYSTNVVPGMFTRPFDHSEFTRRIREDNRAQQGGDWKPVNQLRQGQDLPVNNDLLDQIQAQGGELDMQSKQNEPSMNQGNQQGQKPQQQQGQQNG